MRKHRTHVSDPEVGRFTTQDSFLGEINNPPSLHRFFYANANPTAFVDPTGYTAEGAQLQSTLQETKEYFISQAKDSSAGGAVGWGAAAGAVGFLDTLVGATDTAATATYAVPGTDLLGDPSGQQSQAEIKQQVKEIGETFHTIREEGFGNALGRVAKNAKDQIVAAANGDREAIARVVATGVEVGAPGAALKASGALRAMGKGAQALAGGAARGVRKGAGGLGHALEAATPHLPLKWSANPGSNFGNVRWSRKIDGADAPNAIRERVLANLGESAAARGASNFPNVGRINQELLDVTDRSSRITDRLISRGSTHWARVYNNPALGGARVANIAAKKPQLFQSIIRGNIMDDVAKQLAAKSKIPFLRVTPRGARGADFKIDFLDTAWDVTTPGSWPRHQARYANDPYELLPLLY